jgi:hypothetical protein
VEDAIVAEGNRPIILTQVLKNADGIPGMLALLAKHKGSGVRLQVLAPSGTDVNARLLREALDKADLGKVSLEFTRSDQFSKNADIQAVAASLAEPWLKGLQKEGVRRGNIYYGVAYQADLELTEGDVPELFLQWGAERIRTFLEKAFVVKYQDLNNLGWMARLVAQMA